MPGNCTSLVMLRTSLRANIPKRIKMPKNKEKKKEKYEKT